MISEGSFWTSVNESILLSNKLSLFRKKGTKKGKYSREFLSTVHSDDYRASYNSALYNDDFEILFKDESFFQFSHRPDGFSMTFYPRPSTYVSFDDWLTSYFSQSTDFDTDEFEKFKEEILAEGDSNSEYEQFLIETELTRSVVPIRIDFDPINYCSVYHPLVHLHIGTGNHIRIAIDKYITPLIFFQFIIKNYYPDSFFYKDRQGIFKVNEIINLASKGRCVSIDTNLFQGESHLIFLS